MSGELGTSLDISLRACKEFPTTKKPGRKLWELGTRVTPYSQFSCSQLVVLGRRVKVVESGEFWVMLQHTSCSSSSSYCRRLSAPDNRVVGTSPQVMWGSGRAGELLGPLGLGRLFGAAVQLHLQVSMICYRTFRRSRLLLGGPSHNFGSQDWLFTGGKFLMGPEVKFSPCYVAVSSFYPRLWALAFVGFWFVCFGFLFVCFLPFLWFN